MGDCSTKVCGIDGCERAPRKRSWCQMHYSRWRKNGSPHAKDQKWVVQDFDACVCCGGKIGPDAGFRRYCSRSCATMGKRPRSRSCVSCGSTIDLTKRNERGRLMYSNVAFCVNCRAGVNLRGYVAVLLERDGDSCVLCGDSIDMALRHPNPLSRSVDHRLPRSKGGTEDMSNLGLAHLVCNVRKNAREDWTPQ